MSVPYPYPKLDEDGYELEIVEQDDAKNNPFLPDPIPSDEERDSVKPGDIVKLIFKYRDHVEKNDQTITGEHMWVRVTDYGEGFFIAMLDNDPYYSTILKSDDEVHFHPKHIVKFWSGVNIG